VKLLVYSHFFAPSIGGVENLVLSLARGLAEMCNSDGQREFDITLVTQTPADSFKDCLLPFRVIRQPRFFKLWRLIRDAHIIHLAGPAVLPLLLAWVARKPFVVEHHTYQSVCPNGLLIHQPDASMCPGHFQAGRYLECLACQAKETSWFNGILSLLRMFPRNFLARRASRNIAVSKHVLERNALPRSTVIYHGVEEPIDNGSACSSGVGVPRKICFAYVGRFVSEKGIPVLLQATKSLIKEGHSFDVQLIGDGPERPKLADIIRRDGLDGCASITGYLTGDALSKALSKTHVLVAPSLCEETVGLAAMEQMMRGRLVIVSDIGGLGEVVGESGLRFPSGDAGALAECMRKVLRDPSLLNSFGRKARERSLDQFRRLRMLQEHAGEYRRLFSCVQSQ
jgi:glycogen synthase